LFGDLAAGGCVRDQQRSEKMGGLSATNRRLTEIALIILAGAVVYANSLHVQFVLDDYAGISFHGPREFLQILLHGGSRRVVDLTIALNYHMHGLQVVGYHLVNLVVHLSAALTLYFLLVSSLTALRQTFPDQSPDEIETGFIDRFVPLAVALLFVLHPLQTQAVTYIIQRYTSLATLFYLLSALFFIRARLTFERSGTHMYPILLGGLSLLAAFLAFGSKQTATTLPLMLLTLEITLFRGRLLNRRFYIAGGALALLATGVLLTTWHDRPLDDAFAILNNATAEDRYVGRTTYFLTQVRVVATYLRLLCLPLGQSLFYDYPVYKTLFSLPVIAALTLHISLIAAAVLLFRKSGRNLRTGSYRQGELQRLAALGVAWFYIAMIVESSIFPITDIIFEHRVYLPSVGFFLATATGTAYLVRNRKVAWALLVTVSLALGGLTIARNNLWRDTLTLWQYTVRKAPNRYLAVANLAGVYLERNRPDLAVPAYVRAIELNPGLHISVQMRLGEALQRLHLYDGRFTIGREYFRAVQPGGSGGQDFGNFGKQGGVLFNNLGLAYEHLGKVDLAKKAYRDALWANPDYELAWYNLGMLAKQAGDGGLAVKALMELKRLSPPLAEQLENVRAK
jgi:hypothetical protein